AQRRDRCDYYGDDAFLQKVLRHHAGEEWAQGHERVARFSAEVSTRWREFAEISALPENQPRMMHYDGHGHRIDRILRPRETLLMESEILAHGIFSARTPRWERLAKLLLLHQNGEAGVMCAMACTEGLIAITEAHLDTAGEAVEAIWQHCKEGIDGGFGIGAQFLTEVQGGSDVPANLVEAVPDGGRYRLFGVKFFCSACHADYAVVTAKVTGSEAVSTFVVPTWLSGERERELRNGQIIRRLKRKLGTIELPTAEIEFQGALAYPVGPLGKGVANVVAHVLTLSRLNVSISNAATNLRAAREARLYTEFRRVFGERVIDYPIARGQIAELEDSAQRTLAGLFKVYALFIRLGCRLTAGLPKDDDQALRSAKFRLRILIMLQKIATTREAIDTLHKAMSLFAGHGVMECFSALPRLLRDAMINEQWEGPRNLLLNQIHTDLRRVAAWYGPAQFVADLLEGAPPTQAEELGAALREIVEQEIFAVTQRATDEAIGLAGRWDRLAQDLFTAYQKQALQELQT
ncbi:MAG: acyl-CoA dehydrogenase family protein, partial [Gammaproteobacteria bacterium]|nr:acyl-CoA dehydrogenase family protein [Gammaproteobacteria bacterium]